MKLQNQLAGFGYVEDIYGDLDYQLVVVEYGDDVYKFYWKIEVCLFVNGCTTSWYLLNTVKMYRSSTGRLRYVSLSAVVVSVKMNDCKLRFNLVLFF